MLWCVFDDWETVHRFPTNSSYVWNGFWDVVVFKQILVDIWDQYLSHLLTNFLYRTMILKLSAFKLTKQQHLRIHHLLHPLYPWSKKKAKQNRLLGHVCFCQWQIHEVFGADGMATFFCLKRAIFFLDLNKENILVNSHLGGGFKYFLFSPLPGEMIQFD